MTLLQRDPFARRAGGLLLLGFALTMLSGLLSDGVYHEDDLKHFLFARWAGHDARYLLDEWGRPGFTVPYALPAMVGTAETGWHACRILSAGLSAATAWLAYCIARQVRLRHAWLAIPLIYLQPMFLHLSLTTLTETPLAFYFALATWLLLKRRCVASAGVMALAPITRHEAIVLLPLWALALWRIRASWLGYPLLLWAMGLHNLLAAVFMDQLPVEAFLRSGGAAQYGQGTPLTFLPKLIIASGWVTTALAIMGMKRAWSRGHGSMPRWGEKGVRMIFCRAPVGPFRDDHPDTFFQAHGYWLLVLAPATYFLAETLIYMRGAYASGGYARFLVPIAPWIAVLATAGAQPFFLKRRPSTRLRAMVRCGVIVIALGVISEIEWLLCPPLVSRGLQSLANRGMLAGWALLLVLAVVLYRTWKTGWPGRWTPSWGVMAALALLLVLALPVWAILPLRLNEQQRMLGQLPTLMARHGWDDRPVISVNAWVYYWTDRWMPVDGHSRWHTFEAAEPGTIFVWEPRFCLDPDHDFPLSRLEARDQWQRVWTSEVIDGRGSPLMVLFERQARENGGS